jgi:hypothetical protein
LPSLSAEFFWASGFPVQTFFGGILILASIGLIVFQKEKLKPQKEYEEKKK